MYDSQPVPSGLDTDLAIAQLMEEPATAELWLMTDKVLNGRAGWRLERDDAQCAWFFGPDGQGLLVVSIEPYGLHCFHYRQDTDTTVNSAKELWDWVRQFETKEFAWGAEHMVEMHRQVRELNDTKLAEKLGNDD